MIRTLAAALLLTALACTTTPGPYPECGEGDDYSYAVPDWQGGWKGCGDE